MTTAGTEATRLEQAAHAHARPAVSVVVPCYNGGRFVDQLLATLTRQTFQDFETIIVDDGSTDEATRAKLDSLDPSIRVIHQDNRGMSGARNSGIAAARSDLVLVVDCDDEIDPNYLAEAVPLLKDAPPDVAFVFTHTRLAGAASGIVRCFFNPFALLFANTLPSCMMLRKRCCDAVGGYDESMREGYEDWEFYLRLARAGFRGIEIPKPYYIYHVSPTGMLFGVATRVHGKLWRYMRTKHAESYRLWNLVTLWSKYHDGTDRVSLIKALGSYALALMLPESWYNRLVAKLRHRNLMEGHRPAYKPATNKLKFGA
jgi:glycosyltransferase involved in cell wall biosynthesis